MMEKIIHGEGKRFYVLWRWLQPTYEDYVLKDGDETLLTRESGERTSELVVVCDLLNSLNDQRRNDNA